MTYGQRDARLTVTFPSQGVTILRPNQIITLCKRATFMQTTCPRLLPYNKAERPGIEPATFRVENPTPEPLHHQVNDYELLVNCKLLCAIADLPF